MQETDRKHEQTCKNKLHIMQLDCRLSSYIQFSLMDFSLMLKNCECSHKQGVRFSYFLLPLTGNHRSLNLFLVVAE